MKATQYTTMFNGKKAMTARKMLEPCLDDGKQEKYLINLYPEVHYQTVSFFGGAITDAVGATLEQLPEAQAQQIIDAYFGSEGLGYRAIRTHIDSCDFSTNQYSAVVDPVDSEFLTFSIERDKKRIIPWIKRAYSAAGRDLPVMLSPWSPLAFMKTNGSRSGGGRLRKEYYPLWAKYLCRYISEYRDSGIRVEALSIQNEPNATQTWDSCLFTAEEEKEFLSEYLYPQLCQAGLRDLDIYIWDHNKERLFDRARAEIDSDTDHMIAGLAFHWYSGDHFDALRLVREHYPEKKLIFSEGCIEYSIFDKNQLVNAQMYAHDMLGNFNAGMNSFLDWNIALDENGGPNYVGNYCEAPVICDTKTGEIEFKLSFDYIGHFSRFIRPGACRIATTNFSDRLEVGAFKNPDGKLAIILLNRTLEAFSLFIRLEGMLLPVKLDGNTISTVMIQTED